MKRTTDTLARLVSEALTAAQAQGALPPAGDIEIVIEKPAQSEFGDFSTSTPLKLARVMRMAPLEIGRRIAAAMPKDSIIGKVSVAPPGFVNFTLNQGWLQDQVNVIRTEGDSYGRIDAGKHEKVQVEFVSVNPTGPLHVGHTRGAVIGSTLATVLEAAGFDVQREYYVNDGGAQMKVFYETLYVRVMQAAGQDMPLPEPSYPGEYLKELGEKLFAGHGQALVSRPKEEVIRSLAPEALKLTLENIKQDLGDLGVRYDKWFSEQSLLDTGQFDEAMKVLADRGFIVERDGATWFASTLLGEDKDNVVIRSGEGGPTYFGTDIAYHYNKFHKRQFKRVINVLGADHHGHVSRMKAVVKAIGYDPENLTVILNQLVNFKQGEETVRFSKRKGVIISVHELIEEVGADACRYMFLSRSPDSQMDFDLDLAKKQSSENPVYYVQYAHARLCSVLRTAEERSITFADGDVSLLTHPRESELIRELIELPDVVYRSALRLEPHHLPHFAAGLAHALQRFYEECRVVSNEAADLPVTKARLKLVDASRIALVRTLSLMGMTAPERM
ncbi:MAG: arginine--tRNA ligase [Dehalococcoidia bacterium]|nr:arginine--tRNA ligase [Dehalococcoidia bacterium]MSQ34744.1 arginine--tRNA ligase [Dehalococcoidia bacterium]